MSEEICPHCHRPYQVERENLGPWTIIDGNVFFKGVSLQLQIAHSSIMRVLIRRGQAAYETLILIGARTYSHPDTIKAQICKLRRLLPEGVKIENMPGYGYRLVTP